MAGEPALPRLRRKCRRRSGARATPRWSAERRTSRLRGTGTPRKREVAFYRRDDFKVVRLPALRRPLISGSELQLTPRIWARAPPKRRPRQLRCGGDKRRGTTRAPQRAAGMRDAARQMPRSGLFDIVKNDDGRAGRIPVGCAIVPAHTAGRRTRRLRRGFGRVRELSRLRQHAQRQEMAPDAFHVLDEARVAAGVRAARPRQIVGHDIGDAAGA